MTQSDPIQPIEASRRTTLEFHAFCRVLELGESTILEWVAEGVLRPQGDAPADWAFSPSELDRARRALRLQRDLTLNTEALPLVMDLLGELHRLRRRVRQLEDRFLE